MNQVWRANQREATKQNRLSAVGRLLFNHVDAWSVTGFVGATALLAHDAFTFAGAWLLFSLVVGYWQAFVINDFFDAPFDRTDAKKAHLNFFVHHPLRVPELLAVLLPLDLLVAWGFLQYGWRGIGVMLLCLFLMWAYSAPPLRIKSRPGLDLLVHGCFVETFPYWTCVYLTGGTWGAFDIAALSLLFLASLTAQLEQQIRDYEIDRRFERTFTTVVGRQRAYRLLQVCTALLILVGFGAVLGGAIPWRFAPFGLFALPVLVHRFLRPPGVGRSAWLSWVSIGVGVVYLVGLVVVS
ncbi:MAG: UbiA family prenyltransferase [Caldilineaceae bacterium]|nr:UbiA family prenyltransferase [Caldilineaceae bacterium]